VSQYVPRQQPTLQQVAEPEPEPERELETVAAVRKPEPISEESTEKRVKRSFFDKYIDKIKDFLDNAE